MILYSGEIQTESPSVILKDTAINPFNIPLQNTGLGIFKAKAQIGIFETQEKAYTPSERLRVKNFELSKQHVNLEINVTVENNKYVIDLYQVDLQVKDHMVNAVGLDPALMTLTTEPIVA